MFVIAVVLSGCGTNEQPTLTSSVAKSPDLLYDPLVADSGLSPPTGYCSPNTWKDKTGAFTGTLTNFNCTSSSGWQGAGTSSNPYYLLFDGTNDTVLTGMDVSTATVPTTTWIVWVKPEKVNGADQQ